MPKKATKSVYSVHPSIAYIQSSIRNLEQRTGKTVEAWVDIVKVEGPPTNKERREWLKATHGFGTNYAMWVAERADGKGLEDTDPEAYLVAAEKYVDNMFSGQKAALRPIYEALLKLAFSLGKDVKACPCKTIVPFYRQHVFAEIKPSTRTRIDVGFSLKDTPASGRLTDTGGFAKKDRITHRIPVSSLEDIDGELQRWLQKAYEMDA
jgi:hypothetical protein